MDAPGLHARRIIRRPARRGKNRLRGCRAQVMMTFHPADVRMRRA
jgi:hypothetical protein